MPTAPLAFASPRSTGLPPAAPSRRKPRQASRSGRRHPGPGRPHHLDPPYPARPSPSRSAPPTDVLSFPRSARGAMNAADRWKAAGVRFRPRGELERAGDRRARAGRADCQPPPAPRVVPFAATGKGGWRCWAGRGAVKTRSCLVVAATYCWILGGSQLAEGPVAHLDPVRPTNHSLRAPAPSAPPSPAALPSLSHLHHPSPRDTPSSSLFRPGTSSNPDPRNSSGNVPGALTPFHQPYPHNRHGRGRARPAQLRRGLDRGAGLGRAWARVWEPRAFNPVARQGSGSWREAQ